MCGSRAAGRRTAYPRGGGPAHGPISGPPSRRYPAPVWSDGRRRVGPSEKDGYDRGQRTDRQAGHVPAAGRVRGAVRPVPHARDPGHGGGRLPRRHDHCRASADDRGCRLSDDRRCRLSDDRGRGRVDDRGCERAHDRRSPRRHDVLGLGPAGRTCFRPSGAKCRRVRDARDAVRVDAGSRPDPSARPRPARPCGRCGARPVGARPTAGGSRRGRVARATRRRTRSLAPGVRRADVTGAPDPAHSRVRDRVLLVSARHRCGAPTRKDQRQCFLPGTPTGPRPVPPRAAAASPRPARPPLSH